MKIAFVMDPISEISYKKDSTLAMMIEAQILGHEIFYIEPEDLFLEANKALCLYSPITVEYNAQSWFVLKESRKGSLNIFDVILMRQDPPFDMGFIQNTYILEKANNKNTLVVNNPSALRNRNEKLSILNYPDLISDTLVSSSFQILEDFIQKHKEVVLKPLGLMGGEKIARVNASMTDLNQIVRDLTEEGREKIMAQKFIEEVFEGDKRVLLIDGEHFGKAVIRIPQGDDFRGNLAAGARAQVVDLSERDIEIVDALKKDLINQGVVLAGIDIVGSFLTEINITSPTCLRELNDMGDINLAKKFIERLEKLKS